MRRLGAGVVHLGLGNFHRAHQAVYTEDAGDGWGICAVTRREELIAAMRAQGGLYCVLERGPERDAARVIGAIRDVVEAGAEIERIAAPDTHVVTLTVSESGYGHDPATGRLDAQHPDRGGGPPQTALGRLARGLAARRDAGVDVPLAVVSCDNLTSNGALLRGVVGELAGEPLATWIDAHVDFPSTMVDRIVPATTDADRDTASALIGARDEATVVGEPFSQWVIEDAFRGDRPAWERAGALLVDDVAPYERMKLRLVNGGHSVLAYRGLLAGHTNVDDVMSDDELGAWVVGVIDTELLPTVGAVPGIDLGEYRDALLERFANPRMGHRLTKIAGDGAQKLPPRLLTPARELLAQGREPAGICAAVAGWLRWLPSQTGLDRLHAEIAEAVAGATSPEEAADRALAVRAVFGDDLREDGTFRALLAEAL